MSKTNFIVNQLHVQHDFNHPNVFVSFLLLICSQELLVHLKIERSLIIEVNENQMNWLPEPNGKQRIFNCWGSSGRKVTSFGAQSVDGSISWINE